MISRTSSSKHCTLYTINNWCMNPMNNKTSLTCAPIWKLIVEFLCVKFVMKLFAKIWCISNFIGLELVCQFLPIWQCHWSRDQLLSLLTSKFFTYFSVITFQSTKFLPVNKSHYCLQFFANFLTTLICLTTITWVTLTQPVKAIYLCKSLDCSTFLSLLWIYYSRVTWHVLT